MSHFYNRNNLHKTICEEASGVFDDTLTALRQGGKRSLKILEVGAGNIVICQSHFYYD